MSRERGTYSQRSLAAAALLAVGLLALPGWAQPASATGIRIGEGRLHPFLEADARYDSLVGYFSGTVAAPKPSPDFVIHVRPGLKFDLANASTAITFNGAAEYLFYTGILTPTAAQLSKWPTGLRANVGVDARFNQDGPVEVQVGDNLVRSDRSQNPAAGVGVLSLFNDVHLAVPIHPGGRALEITPHGAWQVEFFEPLALGSILGCGATDVTCSPGLVSRMNYSNVNVGINARWRFLPKTAAVVDVASDIRTYWVVDAAHPNPPATLLRAQAGLAGLITSRINVTLLAGYAGDLAPAQPGATTKKLHNFIGNAEVGFTPTEMIKLSLGYLRTALPVPVYGTYVDDRGYLRGTLGLWAGRLTFSAQAALDYLTFYDANFRKDLAFGGGVGATFAVLSWFDLGLAYAVSFRTSSLTSLSTVNFVRHEVTLRLGLHY